MRLHLTRISPPSLSITLAALYGTIGILYVVAAMLGILIRLGIEGGSSSIPAPGWDLASIIFQPLLFALAGAVSGFVFAWLYNFVARFTKGILIEWTEATRYDD